ncbi:MAG: hypothetical protein QHC65_04255 [Sphingomonas sp.]|nr:hypothetical protein [Sphingomonas sp.]MDX3883611.1 hypothetical protein [Sphingomonas sp.]
MSLDLCIGELIADGSISRDQGDYVARLYEKLERRRQQQFGSATAKALASAEALDAAEAGLKKDMQQKFLQIAAQRGVLDDTGQYRGRDGKWDYGNAMKAVLARDERAPYSNVEYRERAIRQTALGRLAELIAHHSRDITGAIRDKAGLIDLAYEAFGQKRGNAAAAAFARAWLEVADDLRVRANAAGAAIGKIDNWGFPQSHDAAAVREAGFDAWRAAEEPRLDRARMIDRETGQPFDDEGFDALLRTVYDNIVSEGYAGRDEGAGGRAKLADLRSQHRVLIYKDAESWLASHAQFGGTGSIYDVMMGHIHGMARDIALMERLGPNPAATVRWMADVVRKRAMTEEGAGTAADGASYKASREIQAIYDTLSGSSRRPESRRLAQLGETLRGWQVATKLGSAALSTTSDVATGALTRAFNGLPMADIITGYAKHLNPANAEDRLHAARMGFVAEHAGAALSGTARMMAEEMSGEVVRRLAEGTLRLSGLNAITEAGRASWGEGVFAQITRDRTTAFADLDPKFRGMFERYGLGVDAWDQIRASPMVEGPDGAGWITHGTIANRPLADRVMEMVFQEMDVAVPTSGVATRAMLDSVAPKGTWRGEIIRTAFQFKAFPVTLMMTQWQRAMARDNAFDRLVTFGVFFGASALAGAFALQMKEIAKGRNPRPMTSPGFLLEAIAQGGGAGVYGDFVRSTESRFNSGPMQVLAGPAFQTIGNVGSLTVGNAVRAAKGEATHVQSDLHRLARSETPVIGSLWYTRLAYERAALDQWRKAADPRAATAFRQMERKYQRDYNQDYYWAPGDLAPEGAPYLGGALNPSPEPRPASSRAGW